MEILPIGNTLEHVWTLIRGVTRGEIGQSYGILGVLVICESRHVTVRPRSKGEEGGIVLYPGTSDRATVELLYY